MFKYLITATAIAAVAIALPWYIGVMLVPVSVGLIAQAFPAH